MPSRAAWVLLLLALLPASVAAQQAVRGRVFDGESRASVPDVAVRIVGFGGTSVTGSDGRFRIEGVPAGPQLVVFEHPGYHELVVAIVVRSDQEYPLGAPIVRLGAAAAPPPPPLASGAGFDWAGEGQPYAWGRAFGSAFVGHAVGLGLGVLAANQCLAVEAGHGLDMREGCNTLASVAAGGALALLPSLAAGYAARWGGATTRSEGRLLPALLLGALPTLSGYLLYIGGEADDSPVVRGVGIGLLAVGTPALMTLSDRFFRAIR